MALGLVFAIFPLARSGLARWQGYCVCVQQPTTPIAAMPAGAAVNLVGTGAGIVIDETSACSCSPVTVAGVTVLDGLHWLSAGATAFARGLNDAPKILGLGVIAAAAAHVSVSSAFLIVAAAMAAGSVARGFKVTETLARKVTPMSPLEGFAANLVTSLLVIFASRLALPVSTTHVSSAAIIGLGLKRDTRAVRWKTVTEMLLAWIVTLPSAALIAALVYLLFRSVS
jgi:PiT family inorganic phosphate transporter